MATVETTRYVDDLTGGDADETVAFGLDGDRFEIDLSSVNAERLRGELAPFLAVARTADTPGARRARARAASTPVRAGRSAGAPDAAAPKTAAPQVVAPKVAAPKAAGSDAASRAQNHAVRAWARENGYTVSERGRIPSEVVAAYHRGCPADGADAATTGTERAGAETTGSADPGAADTRAEQAGPASSGTGATSTGTTSTADTGADEPAAAKTGADAEAPGPVTVLFSG